MRRIDEWMPLFIARYLADTVHLNNAMSGSYLHALMYEWVAGPLPNDMEQCARIMKIEGLGASDLAFALLKNFFEQVQDQAGNPCWIQKRAEQIKANLLEKAVKYSERAQKANAIRWHGHVAKYPTRTPKTESVILQGLPQAMRQAFPEGMQQGIPVLQVLEVPVPTKGDSLRSSPEGQPQAAGLISGLEKHPENESRPNGHGKGSRAAHLKTPPDAPPGARTAISATEGEKIAGARQSSRNSPPVHTPETAPKPPRVPDPRFVSFRNEFRSYWKKQNPGGLNYAWAKEDGRALNVLLRKYKSLDLERFKALLRNRAQSDAINPAEPPSRWLAQLGEYAAGPLDRYRKPK